MTEKCGGMDVYGHAGFPQEFLTFPLFSAAHLFGGKMRNFLSNVAWCVLGGYFISRKSYLRTGHVQGPML
jgi:hypothetical protein